ncbi:MAG TPA: DNA methyltransferase [Dehalococcoidia bacterium]|nr:DNA methyltransferase [Dehalococcoidia bacterium]
MSDIKLETVYLKKDKAPPADYHCHCKYCMKSLGELIRKDGIYYNKNERKKYYSKEELSNAKVGEKGGHVAKTPLHIARWAVQSYSEPGDWVLDPTMGAGTTAVEALNHGRNAAGMEIEFIDVIQANIAANNNRHCKFKIWHGDARAIGSVLEKARLKFQLIVNNPPYFADQSQKGKGVHEGFDYQKDLPNLAFLKEGPEYFATMGKIYADSVAHLNVGGHLVIGIKDGMKNKKPDQLHEKVADCITKYVPGMKFVGTAFLKHYPTTLFLNTYFKQFGIHPPYYQTIMIWKKVK